MFPEYLEILQYPENLMFLEYLEIQWNPVNQ
jgi:hypothetical protein